MGGDRGSNRDMGGSRGRNRDMGGSRGRNLDARAIERSRVVVVCAAGGLYCVGQVIRH